MLSPFLLGVTMPTTIVIITIFILHLLVVATLLRMLKMKIKAVKNKEVSTKDFVLTKDSKMNDDILNVSNHLRNLFQIPLLFQILILVYLSLGKVTLFVSILALIFVITRIVHSYVHLMTQNVRARFRSFIAGNITVVILWVNLFVNLALGK